MNWYKFFKKNSTSIEWKFFSKSLEKKDWKLNKREGGGIINYYGVHFVFLLSFLKKIEVKILESIFKKKNYLNFQNSDEMKIVF